MPTIKAHFDGRAIVPDQPVNLAEGQPLVVHFEPAPEEAPAIDPSQHVLEWIVQNLVEKSDLPSDAGVQHDHYLYGTPKRKL